MLKLAADNKLFVLNVFLVAGLIAVGLLMQGNDSGIRTIPLVGQNAGEISATSSATNRESSSVASDTIPLGGSSTLQSGTPGTPAQNKATTPPPIRRRSNENEYYNENE